MLANINKTNSAASFLSLFKYKMINFINDFGLFVLNNFNFELTLFVINVLVV